MKRLTALASVLLAAATALSACGPRKFVLLPAPPVEVRREPAATPQVAPDAKKTPETAPPPDPAKTYAEAIARTRETIARGKGKEVLPLWKALEGSPWAVDAIFHQGVLLHLAGDLDGAAAQYRRVTDNAPVFEPAAANLLGIYLLRGEKEPARSLAARALPDPSVPPAGILPELQSNVAALLIETGDPGKAAPLLFALRAKQTAGPAVAWNMAVMAYRQGDPSAAKRFAGEISPALASLWPVAASRFAWEREGGRIPTLDNVPATEPKMAALARNLSGYAEYIKGEREAAKRYLLARAGEKDNPAELINNLGLIQTELGEWKEARANLERAIREKPEMPEGWINLGLFRELYEGDAAGAIECYKYYIKLNGLRRNEVLKWIDGLQISAPPRP